MTSRSPFSLGERTVPWMITSGQAESGMTGEISPSFSVSWKVPPEGLRRQTLALRTCSVVLITRPSASRTAFFTTLA
ncbi:hypothetical protein D9M71_270370 [compost metagenome]